MLVKLLLMTVRLFSPISICKEVQILREGLEVLGEPTLENAKRKVEHTSYLITIFGFLEKTYYVSDGSTKQTKFQTNSLLNLHKWLDENIN